MARPLNPYFIRAVYDWAVDSNLSPHIVVDASLDGCNVPQQFVEDGHIVLNISPAAVRDFHMNDEGVSFNARFSGQPVSVFAPINAIEAIFAKESGQGISFAGMLAEETGGPDDDNPSPDGPRGGPRLRVVK